MKRFPACCLCSALLGSLFTLWLTDSSHPANALAQTIDSHRGPVLAPQRPQAVAPAPIEAAAATDYSSLTPEEVVAVAAYEMNNKAVVNITTKTVDAFFLLDVSSEGTGSGAILDKSGHVLTNLHVIEDAKQVSVTLFDGKSYDASLVGADPVYDVAVLKIDAPADVLFPVTLGDSSALRVGMRVFAIGNPFGLERTMTTGIISSLNRSLKLRGDRTIKSIIQVDAAVNPGNSGGPLIDSHGRVIGMNTAIATRTGQNSGVGFAIPVNIIARIVPQVIERGHVIRPEIGIQRVYETEKGLMVATLTPGGPAERAGLRGPRVTRTRGPFAIERIDRSAADTVLAIDGEKVENADDFLGVIESRKVGDKVVLTIRRDGREQKVEVELVTSEQATAAAPAKRRN